MKHLLVDDEAIMPTKRIYQNFGFGGLISGQCYDLSIVGQREYVEMLLYSESTVDDSVLFI